MAKIRLVQRYTDIVCLENLLAAWGEFVRGKRSKIDVQEFGRDLMGNIIDLHRDLSQKTYRHSEYQAFTVTDPKPRSIHKSVVRDRLLHHAVYRILYPFFDRTFIADSFSCRLDKGTHKALDRFRAFGFAASLNHTRTVRVLKCDVRKFFASIDQRILLEILAGYIPDPDALWLLERIIFSFHSTGPGVGLPLGNLTSQLLVNVYMNEFDQFVKHRLKARHYLRYADDFAIFSRDERWLWSLLPQIADFLWNRLRLRLHPGKVSIGSLASGVDFLGWVHFPDHRVLRTTTKRRMLRRIDHSGGKAEVMISYSGLLQHGNSKRLLRSIEEHNR